MLEERFQHLPDHTDELHKTGVVFRPFHALISFGGARPGKEGLFISYHPSLGLTASLLLAVAKACCRLNPRLTSWASAREMSCVSLQFLEAAEFATELYAIGLLTELNERSKTQRTNELVAAVLNTSTSVSRFSRTYCSGSMDVDVVLICAAAVCRQGRYRPWKQTRTDQYCRAAC